MFGARERYLRKSKTLTCFMASALALEHVTSFVMMSFVGVFGVLLFCYLSSLLQSVVDVEIPSTYLQCELPITEFQVWSKVIRSCRLSLKEEADSPQSAIEFNLSRDIDRPWDVWLRNSIRFGYRRTKQCPTNTCPSADGAAKAISMTSSCECFSMFCVKFRESYDWCGTSHRMKESAQLIRGSLEQDLIRGALVNAIDTDNSLSEGDAFGDDLCADSFVSSRGSVEVQAEPVLDGTKRVPESVLVLSEGYNVLRHQDGTVRKMKTSFQIEARLEC